MWRENALKVIVLVGDAPPHGKGGSSQDNFPERCPCGHDAGILAEVACNRGIAIFCLGIGSSCSMQESFKDIVDASNTCKKEQGRKDVGRYIPLNSASMLIDIILTIAEAELDLAEIDSIVYKVYRPDLTPQSIAAITDLKIGDVDASLSRLLERKMIKHTP